MASIRRGSAGSEAASRQWRVPSKLVMAVLPLSIVAILVSVFLLWGEPGGTGSWSSALTIGVAVVLVVAAVGSLITTYAMGRSMARAVTQASSASRRIAGRDLVELFDAIGTGGERRVQPLGLDVDRGDEIGDLARSTELLHRSLVETAARQVEALRVGVSSIFVTLARRNSTLVSNQLALLDELEDKEEDPDTLGSFYRIDHLAARMRRNAESLLVLAGSESPRTWAEATEISDVVRAAASEVDEYRRIDVLALEPARLDGGAASDVTHLLAELLENAVQFSPPSEMVRVTGLYNVEGYQLSISDNGLGISEAKLAEMNRILRRPPRLGLSVEPTLGVFVVAKLAHRHGLTVELASAMPGLTATVVIPRERLVSIGESLHDESGDELPAFTLRRSRRPAPERRSTGHPSELPVIQPVGGEGQVIDLTVPEMTVDEQEAPEFDPSGLPIRRPGASYRSDDMAESVVAGEAPSTIRSALSAYDKGRYAAAGEDDTEQEPEELS